MKVQEKILALEKQGIPVFSTTVKSKAGATITLPATDGLFLVLGRKGSKTIIVKV